MASLLRMGSRYGPGMMGKNPSLLARSPPAAALGVEAQLRKKGASSEEKAAARAALDKKMRETHGIISHEESLKDNTKYETLPVDTHTARHWDEVDPRNARFMDHGKLTVKM